MIFFLPLLVSMILGCIFPYIALALMPYGFIFFFVLMLCAGLSMRWQSLRQISRHAFPLVFANVFLFIFFPLLQLAIARLLIADIQYQFGVYFGALAPVAIVSPYFTKIAKGDEELSYLFMISSSLLYPFVCMGMLALMPFSGVHLELMSLTFGMVIFVITPIVISMCSVFVLSDRNRQRIEKITPFINASCLSLLVFILFGAAYGRLNLYYSSREELLKLILLAFFQDFGVLLFGFWLLPKLFTTASARSLAISFSMKNTAVAAALLLFYVPKAAIPATLVFLPHALLFAYLQIKSKKTCN